MIREPSLRRFAHLAFLVAVAIHLASQIEGSAAASDSCEWPGEYFPDIPYVKYEGPSSKNPFAYRFYDADEVILGKPMKEWLRFSVAFWHTFRGDGSDPFGSPTKVWPWEDPSIAPMEMAKRRMRAHFEFVQKLGVQFWCFHDRDIAPEGATWAETNANLNEIADLAEQLQQETGVGVLWGTAQGESRAQSCKTLVGEPKGSDPSPRKVCQNATLNRSHSFIGFPRMTSSAS